MALVRLIIIGRSQDPACIERELAARKTGACELDSTRLRRLIVSRSDRRSSQQDYDGQGLNASSLLKGTHINEA